MVNLQKTTKLFAATLIGTAALVTISSCNKTGGKANSSFELPTDMPVGSKDAKVVMVEYASVTCVHCAAFQKDVMPTIHEKYISTGKVRYVYREFPTPPIEISMAGHLLARCVSPDKRAAVIDALMNTQVEIITQSQGPSGAKQPLLNVAKSVGMGEADFDKCMQDQAKLRILADVMEHGQNTDKITGTPTILINGKAVAPPVGTEYTPKYIGDALDAELVKTAGAAK